MSENVLVLGALSGIAQALCHLLAAGGCKLVLAARAGEELERVAADLRIRYQAEIFMEPFDAVDYDSHPAFFARCLQRIGGHLDGVILCHGYLSDQARSQQEFGEARRAIDVNFTSAVSLLSLAGNHLEARRTGFLAAISSVAGDRGRQSNYTYGAAKAGLTAFLQGLRNRLWHHGVNVLTVKPGFVDTPMTQGRIDPRSRLVASPERVARDIYRAIRRRKNAIYTPWFWKYIMWVIRWIPEPIFKRLRL
jgi:decaprenylphospho-beta-D-erythro-pentofuranosid-2-ulose 2-reductase